MKHPPIRIRTFILAIALLLLLVPTLAAGAAWLITRDHQQAGIKRRLDTAVAYLTSHHPDEEQKSVPGFANLLDRLDLLAQVVIAGPHTKSLLYLSPALDLAVQEKQAASRTTKTQEASTAAAAAPTGTGGASLVDDQRLIPTGTPKSPGTLAVNLYYRPASRTTRALVALVTGVIVLLAELAAALWLAGRWMVTPLTRLSAEVDKVAGGDLTITVPGSRIGEVANIAQAVDGMTAALGETAQRRAEADEARQFLVTSIAHDLRTPLFALRGHLQAIQSRLGSPDVHLERAGARADALERLIGNLFAYTRDDYAQPTVHLEAIPVATLLDEVTASLDHTARLRHITFVLEGDQALVAVVDRDRVKRALTNILDNALRYSPPETPIQLNWTADTSTVQITIHDRGPGIDLHLLPHIFEPGIRGAPATDSADGGAGLGLTIAKRLLEHQHATLTVQNDPAGGARITVILQRAPPPIHPSDTELAARTT